MREGEDLSGNKARQAAAAAAAKAAVTADAAASVIVLVIRTGRHPCARARGCGHACMIPLLPPPPPPTPRDTLASLTR